VKRSHVSAACVLVWVLLMAGCAGKGEVRYLDLSMKPPSAQMAAAEPVKIVIEPFEDRRLEKGRIGMRSHLWGGVTYFDIAGERPGEFIAQALADRLKTRGWHERAWNVRVAPAGSVTDADIVITGVVQDFSANAKSRVFSTVINTSGKLTIQAKNQADRSTTTRSVENSQTKTVFWFSEDDVQELLTATLKDGIDRLIADTMIEQRSLRPAH
jgi:uncharacterized lipoprotein YajG